MIINYKKAKNNNIDIEKAYIVDRTLSCYITRLKFEYDFEVDVFCEYIYKIYTSGIKMSLDDLIIGSLHLIYNGFDLKYLVDLPKDNLIKEINENDR